MYDAHFSPAPAPEVLERPVRGFDPGRGAFVLVDKPLGLSSQAVVSRLRRILGIKKIGHAGTLDPAASGLLLVGVGRATRLLSALVGADKVYRAHVRFGQSTRTEDAEGEVTAARGARVQDVATRLEAALAAHRGPIAQVPSAVSAIKVDGKRAHALVRAGADVQLAARDVTIYRLRALGQPTQAHAGEIPVVDVALEVACSSGTYVRALARDLGDALGCGAHLTALRRIGVGDLDVASAYDLARIAEDVAEAGTTEAACLLPTGQVMRHFVPCVDVTLSEARPLAFGGLVRPGGPVPESGMVGLVGPGEECYALAEPTPRGLQPRAVIVVPERA